MTAERSSISYIGEVSLCIMHGSRKVRSLSAHNKGTLSLMSFLAKCLGGEYDSAKAPRYVRMFYIEESTGELSADALTSETEKTVQQIASNFLPEYASNASDEEASVTMSFLVPYSLMKNNNAGVGTKCNALGIYSSDDAVQQSSALAFVKLDKDVELTDGESLMVSWKMTLKNNDDADTSSANG